MRTDGPSSYDPRILQSDVRIFKRLLRSTPGVSQVIVEIRWIEENLVRVWTGGSGRSGGCMMDFIRINREWSIVEVSHYIS